MAATKLHSILRNRYYLGVITWHGVEHPGKHPALIDPAIFATVQQLLEQRRTAGDKTRKHHHYLSGSLRCGRCGQRLLYGFGSGRMGTRYDYFFLARHPVGKSCDLPYLPADQVERAVEDQWASRRSPRRAHCCCASISKLPS
jgi:hypothetical protein